MTPTVSVVITTYNSEQFIASAVESVLAQTYKDIEVLVVDDGSTDDTRHVLESYGNQIHYIWQENQERSAARNHGVGLAKGDLIAFLDSDDVWLKEKLALQVDAIQRFPQAVMVYGCAQIIDPKGTPTRWWGEDTIGSLEGEVESSIQDNNILFGSSLTPSIAMIRKDAFEQIGGFDTTIHRGIGEDWDLWIRLSSLGPFVRIPRLVAQYRTFGMERELSKRATDYYVDRSLYVIDKNVAADTGRFSPPIVRRAQANIYLQAGLAHIELGEEQQGKPLIFRAIQIDPTIGTRENFCDVLEHIGRRKWRDGQQELAICSLLRRIVTNIPEETSSKIPNLRQIMGRVYMSETFAAYHKKDWNGVRQVIWRGLISDPGWLINRGVLSIAAQLLLRTPEES